MINPYIQLFTIGGGQKKTLKNMAKKNFFWWVGVHGGFTHPSPPGALGGGVKSSFCVIQ